MVTVNLGRMAETIVISTSNSIRLRFSTISSSMTIKSHHHSWLRLWLSCVLSVLLTATPLVVSMLPDDVRCEESDTSEEGEVGEVTLSASNNGQRRSRREQSGVRRALVISNSDCSIPQSLCAQRPSAGQASLWGRCGRLHC